MKIITIPPAPPENRKKRVAAYARVSTSSEALLHSLEVQTAYYTSVITSHPDWEFAGIYADKGISGTGISDRREFQRLLSDCKAGRIDMILTKSVSRFSRNTVDLLQTVRRLKELGIEVFFERENISTCSTASELMLTVASSFAQEESRSISENVRWGIRRGFEAGRMNAFVLYGYRGINGVLQPEPQQAEAVRLIFRSYLSGDTARQTVSQLNDMGASTYYGGKFTPDAVRSVLRQEKYTGSATLQLYYIESHITHRRRRNNGVLPQYHVPRSHPALISREDFEAVKLERTRRRILGIFASGAVHTNCFTSRIQCALCGRNFRRYGRYARSGECLSHYWCCSLRKTHGTDYCNNEYIPEEQLKKACSFLLGGKFSECQVMTSITHMTALGGGFISCIFTDFSRMTINWRAQQ